MIIEFPKTPKNKTSEQNPTTSKEYLKKCKQILTEEDYMYLCVCILDVEEYNTSSNDMKDIVDTYFSFKG